MNFVKITQQGSDSFTFNLIQTCVFHGSITFLSIVPVLMLSDFFVELDLRLGKVAHLGNDFPVNISEDVLSEVFIPISGLAQEDEGGDDNIGKAGCEFDS